MNTKILLTGVIASTFAIVWITGASFGWHGKYDMDREAFKLMSAQERQEFLQERKEERKEFMEMRKEERHAFKMEQHSQREEVRSLMQRKRAWEELSQEELDMIASFWKWSMWACGQERRFDGSWRERNNVERTMKKYY